MGVAQQVLITGASGFVGRCLLDEAARRGLMIRVLIHERPVQAAGVEQVRGDLARGWFERDPCLGVDMVWHSAGLAHADVDDYQQHWRSHVDGTSHLLDSALRNRVRHFTYVSSVKAAADPVGADPASDTWNPPPDTAYGQAKREAEARVLAVSNRMDVVVLRPALMYGPGVKGNLRRLVAMARRGYWMLPDTGGRRAMLDVRDLARAVGQACEAHAAFSRVLVLADGEPLTGAAIMRMVRVACGRRTPAVVLPYGLLWALSRMGDWSGSPRAPLDTRRLRALTTACVYDHRPAWRALGIEPQWRFRTALADIIASLDAAA